MRLFCFSATLWCVAIALRTATVRAVFELIPRHRFLPPEINA